MEFLTPEVKRLRDLHFDPALFKPWKTGKPIDYLMSRKGGLMPGTVTVLAGGPGVGKTSVGLDILVCLVRNYPELPVVYITGEMTESDMYEEAEYYPALMDVPTLYLNRWVDKGLDKALEASFNQGYAVVLMDSFSDIAEKTAEEKGWPVKRAEIWLLNAILQTAETKHTCFLVIQQFTKSGEFVGSNKLKHNTTGFVYFLRDKIGKPFLMFDKNRRNGRMVQKPLYFNKSKTTGEIEYDWTRFERDRHVFETSEDEHKRLIEEAEAFEALFKQEDHSNLPPPENNDKNPENYGVGLNDATDR